MNLRAQEGWTTLSLASLNGQTDCVRLLLESGADKDAKNNVRCVFSFCMFALVVE
jgi:ankyrin repeat protein